ncbi:MAG: putative toxin-antitoxin system toxin component, PIN family [Acidobacteria bacterium]|nr:putative toxin-antitoxin system toxin component, PIN family [Acidobacteriota bacterium]
MRAVFDTNVLVSAFLFPGGPPEAAYRLALERRIDLVTSAPLLAEFGRVLSAKFGRDLRAVSEAVAQVAAIAVVARPTEHVCEIEEDPDDDRVLEAALAGRAGVIVSGDKHLLRLRTWRGARIISPAVLVAEVDSP